MFKLAISNIAWDKNDDPEVWSLLRKYNVSGIEVAPTKIWTDWENANYKEAVKYRQKAADAGFEIPSMQSLLFGKNQLQLFDRSTHKKFTEHIRLLAEIASGLGAKVLVFGSPKNRRRGAVAFDDAMKIAAEIFHNFGEICADADCAIGLEPNPAEYNCDFITNTADAARLVKLASSPGFKLHFDCGAAAINHEDIPETLEKFDSFIHYHISAPMLINIASDDSINHRENFMILQKSGYRNFVSIEMRREEPELEKIESALKKVTEAINDCQT